MASRRPGEPEAPTASTTREPNIENQGDIELTLIRAECKAYLTSMIPAFIIDHHRLWRLWGGMVVDRAFGGYAVMCDIVSQMQHNRDIRVQLDRSERRLREVAASTAKQDLTTFCDVVVTFGPDLLLTESSPQLAVWLGRQARKHKWSLDLIEATDREAFEANMRQFAEADSEHSHPMTWRTSQVKLQDAYAVPVPVHLLHIRFQTYRQKPVCFTGVLEAWRPKKQEAQDTEALTSA